MEAEAEAGAQPERAAPTVTVLSGTQRAGLPFTVDLPVGFEIVSRPQGPDFAIYSVRRGAQPFVMIYAGPSSQFPIYDGQMAQAGGRSSIVVTENGTRRAVEHLFQREAAPKEIHIWVASLEGADAALAEQIAQTVDLR